MPRGWALQRSATVVIQLLYPTRALWYTVDTFVLQVKYLMIKQTASVVWACPAAPVCLQARATQLATRAAQSVSHGKQFWYLWNCEFLFYMCVCVCLYVYMYEYIKKHWKIPHSLHSICDSGKWRCSENICPARCIIEGQHVTTFDGKEYVLPGKCTYVALQVIFFPLPRHLTLTHVVFLMILTAILKSLLRVSTGQ